MARQYRKLLVLIPLLIFFVLAYYVHEKKRSVNPNLLDQEPSWLTIQRQRKAMLNFTCSKYKLYNQMGMLQASATKMMHVEHRHKFIYCEVPKAGCTNWKRILLLLKTNFSRDFSELPMEKVHNTSLHKKLSAYPLDKQKQLLRSYTKVMFTREPFERLVSAYRDKFFANKTDQYYIKVIANQIKSKFRSSAQPDGPVTFLELVRFILDASPGSSDVHWRPMYLLCDPCNVHYDIIGKYETLKEDSDEVLKAIGAPPHLRYPEIREHATNTSGDIARSYFDTLGSEHLLGLVNRYYQDFALFNYSLY